MKREEKSVYGISNSLLSDTVNIHKINFRFKKIIYNSFGILCSEIMQLFNIYIDFYRKEKSQDLEMLSICVVKS